MSKVIAQNRKARFHYTILEKYEAGIQLRGTEVKSVRLGRTNINDAFCRINSKNELEILNMHISPYEFGNRFNHEPFRIRKLLLHKKEIRRLYGKVEIKGLSLVPLSLYFKTSYLKVELALVKGKKIYDKKQILKEKDIQKEHSREMKKYFQN